MMMPGQNAARDLGLLSLAELTEYRRTLDLVGKAAKILADGGLEPVITLNARETLLRAPSILGAAQDDGAVLEPVDADLEAVIPLALRPGDAPVFDAYRRRGEGKAETLTPWVSNPDAPDLPAAAAPLPVTDHINKAHERCIGPDGLLRGSWLPEEEALLRDLAAEGVPFSVIARRLNRPVPGVQFRARNVLKLKSAVTAARKTKETGGSSGRKAAPVTPPGEAGAVAVPVAAHSEPGLCIGLAEAASGGDQPDNSGVAEAPQSVPAPAGPRDAVSAGASSPRAGAAEAPAAERGQPPAPPPQGAAGSAGRPACPEGLSATERRIWFEIAALKAEPPFDPGLDLDLVTGLEQGRKLGELALELDIDSLAARARSARLNNAARDDKDRLTPAGQEALRRVLELRLALSREAAA